MKQEIISAEQKVYCYEIACALFEEGKSQPQVLETMIEITKEFADDNATANLVTDKAFKNSWTLIDLKSKELFSNEKAYGEVLDVLKITFVNEDEEILKLYCDKWYSVKSVEMESIVESDIDKGENYFWLIAAAVVLPLLFYFNASTTVKIVWSIVLIGTIGEFIVSRNKRKKAAAINKFFKDEQTK